MSRRGEKKGRQIVSGMMLWLFLISVLMIAFRIPCVKASDSWVWVRDTVTGAYGEAVVGTDTDIYIARGMSFYRYRPADNSWQELTSAPKPDYEAFKTGTALAWDFGDHIYALYGAATGDSRRWFYRYSISQNSWEALANTSADQGEGDAMAWVSTNNCIYATIGSEHRPTYLVLYDPSTNTWSDAPEDPPVGMGDGASPIWAGDNFLYVLRGEFYETSPLYDFWRYSLSNNTWTSIASIPATPHDEGEGGVGDVGSLLYVGFWLSTQTDYIYALSGNQADPDGIPDNRTFRYTISTNIWERLADLPFGVGYYVGCRLGYADGSIFASQGAPSTWVGGGDDLAKYRFPKTWIVDDDGPADFHTIHEAINTAEGDDTIFVKNGRYYEKVNVDKSVSLVGENPTSTVVYGQRLKDVFLVTSSDVTITNFTIMNSSIGYNGISLLGVQKCVISKCNMTTNFVGVGLYSSSNNTISGNNVTNGWEGIVLDYFSTHNLFDDNRVENNMDTGIVIYSSPNNTLKNNRITNNMTGDVGGGILIFGSPNNILRNKSMSGCFSNFGVADSGELSNFIQDIDTSNTANNKPIYYWINKKDQEVPSDAGYVAAINSSGIIVENLTLENNYDRVLLFPTTNSSVVGNNITSNAYGIGAIHSSYNKILDNRAIGNGYGIRLVIKQQSAAWKHYN